MSLSNRMDTNETGSAVLEHEHNHPANLDTVKEEEAVPNVSPSAHSANQDIIEEEEEEPNVSDNTQSANQGSGTAGDEQNSGQSEFRQPEVGTV